MASIIKSNTYADFNGREILTANNDGALTTQKINYPAFEAYLNTEQTVSDNTNTKVQFDTKIFDTDNAYDNTTNYRFTPQVAGKYYIYTVIACDPQAATNLSKGRAIIYKNGSVVRRINYDFNANYVRMFGASNFAVIDLNGSTDYIEIYGLVDRVSGSSRFTVGDQNTFFGAYRIGS